MAERDKLTASKSSGRPRSPAAFLAQEETGPLLERICGEVSGTTRGADFVDISNSPESHSKLQDLLPAYFYTWQLHNQESVVVFLLLQWFILKRDCSDLLSSRHDYESAVERLKERVVQLEGGGEGEGALRKEVKELRAANHRLTAERDRLFTINHQWAVDYESLTRRVAANPSGLISTPAPSVSSDTAAVCLSCRELERKCYGVQHKLEENQDVVERLRRDMKERLRCREQEIKHLEGENQAIHAQLQELGDLQAALRLKEEHSRLQHRFTVMQRQYQDVVGERLHLQNQLERVRMALLSIFPHGLTALGRERSGSSFALGGGYNTHPTATKHCRRQQHQYLSEPIPPTPPGLIARGEHRGSLVEKDLKPADEQVTGFEKTSLPANEPRTWPGETAGSAQPRPSSLLPGERPVKCPSCAKSFGRGADSLKQWFEHVRFCDSDTHSA